MENLPKVLAIDYGTQRVGVAVSYGSLAEPLIVLDNNDQLFEKLIGLVSEHQVEQILVGLSENQMAEITKKFVAQLKDLVKIPVIFFDETLSSATVHTKLHERNQKKRQHTGPIDHYAAAEVLQEYLEELRLRE